MAILFDGAAKRIVFTTTEQVDVVDMYSRWKEWVCDGNAQWDAAFRSVGGDPIASGQVVAPYIFLNTTAGWRIRPAEAQHELRFVGNLYSEDALLSMFVQTLGDFAVTVVVERSASAIGMDVGGGGGGGGLTSAQATMLSELHKLMGLDPLNPVYSTFSSRKVPASGTLINQSTLDDGTTLILQRQ